MIRKVKKFVALLLVASMIFTSSAFSVFAEGVNETTVTSKETTMTSEETTEISEETTDIKEENVEEPEEDATTTASIEEETTTSEEEQTTTAATEEETTTTVAEEEEEEEEQTTTVAKEEDETTIAAEEETTTTAAKEEEQTTTVEVEEQTTTIAVEDQTTTAASEEQTSTVVKEDQTTIVAEVETVATVSEAETIEESDIDIATNSDIKELVEITATKSEAKLLGAPAPGDRYHVYFNLQDQSYSLEDGSPEWYVESIKHLIDSGRGVRGYYETDEAGYNGWVWYDDNTAVTPLLSNDEAKDRVDLFWSGGITGTHYLLPVYDYPKLYVILFEGDISQVPESGYTLKSFKPQGFIKDDTTGQLNPEASIEPNTYFADKGFYYPQYRVSKWNTAADGSGDDKVYGDNVDLTFFDPTTHLARLYSKEWEKVKFLNPSLNGVTNTYNVNDTFATLFRIFGYQEDYHTGHTIYYSAATATDWEFDPPLTTPLQESNTKMRIKYLAVTKNDDTPIEFEVPILVGDPTHTVHYEQNLPTGTWEFVDTDTSRATNWATDFADQTADVTSFTSTTMSFTSPLTIKGVFADGDVVIRNTATNQLKVLKEFNTVADGTGQRYSLGQVLNGPTDDFTNKLLTLNAVWDDIRHFYLGYTKDGSVKEVKNELNFANVDEIVSKITYAKLLGWHEIAPAGGVYTDASVLSAYDNTTAATMTTDELKTELTNWETNKTANKAYGATTSPLQSIAVKEGTTLKTSYAAGEALSVDNLVIIPTYADSTTGDDIAYSTPEFEINPAVGTVLTAADNGRAITITYGPTNDKKTCSYTIEVIVKTVESIEIAPGIIADESLKTKYKEGERISLTNLAIVVTYDDATTAHVPYAGNEAAFSFRIKDKAINVSTYKLAKSDEGDITVVYSEKTCTYPITVEASPAPKPYNPSSGDSGSSGGSDATKPPAGFIPTTNNVVVVPVSYADPVGGFYNINADTYCRSSTGTQVVGWVTTPAQNWYLFEYQKTRDEGKMIKGFRKEASGWYYFETDGVMATGIRNINNETYYFEMTKDNKEGLMATGWRNIAGKWYYFTTSGAMLKNTTTPDNYKVDATGAWIQ